MSKKTAEFRDLDVPSLVLALADAKQEAFNLRFRNATGQLDNPSRLREVRRDIARINTLLRQHEIAAAERLNTEKK
jgi:large subunit ribosomal protein L29